MPVSIISARLLRHAEDHVTGMITALMEYTFNTDAVETKNHSDIPIAAVDAIAAQAGRSSRTPADICAVIKAGLGDHAADLTLTIASPPV